MSNYPICNRSILLLKGNRDKTKRQAISTGYFGNLEKQCRLFGANTVSLRNVCILPLWENKFAANLITKAINRMVTSHMNLVTLFAVAGCSVNRLASSKFGFSQLPNTIDGYKRSEKLSSDGGNL